MAIVLGTNDGVWQLEDGKCTPSGLKSSVVSHVATRRGTSLAAVPRDGLYKLANGGQRRIWEGDARTCAIGPDGKFYVGIEPAMVYRSDDDGETWKGWTRLISFRPVRNGISHLHRTSLMYGP